MSDSGPIDTRRHTCHCGHDRATHYRDPNPNVAPDQRYAACLGARCDCPFYRPDDELDPHDPKPRRPSHAFWCRCHDCKAYAAWLLRQPTPPKSTPSIIPKPPSTWPMGSP